MDERRARIYDDLRGVVEGDLYFEPLDRAPYAHDASLYEIDPLGVIVPRNEDDVVSVVRYAAENRIPLHVRGAGTDTGGGSLGPGLVVDLSRHLRKVIAIGPEHVVVEPGVVLDVLNARLAPLGRRLEPVPERQRRHHGRGDDRGRCRRRRGRCVMARSATRSIGFASSSRRARWPIWGSSRGRHFEAEPTDLKDLIVRKLQTLYPTQRGPARAADAGRAAQSRRLCAARCRRRVGNSSRPAGGGFGRDLGGRAAGGAAHASRCPRPRGSCLLPFVGLSDAAAFVPELLDPSFGASSCDLFDRRSLSLARDADASFRGWIDEAAEAILTVEFEGNDPDEVAGKVRLLCERARRSRALVAEPFATLKRAECERLLGLRRLVEPLLMRFRGRARPVSFVDDVAVPPDRLAPVLQRLQSLLQQQNVTWTLDAYAGEGRLRLRPFLDLSDPGDRAKLEPLASRVYDIVLEAGGTISSAQGCGLARTQFLRKQYGELVQVFREIKDAFDPQDQLNPGKVIGDDPHLMLRNLKPWHAAPDPADAGVGRQSLSSPGAAAR